MARSYKHRKQQWAFKAQLKTTIFFRPQLPTPQEYPDEATRCYVSHYLESWILPGTPAYERKKRAFHSEKKDYCHMMSAEPAWWRRTHVEKPYRQKTRQQLHNWLKGQDSRSDCEVAKPLRGAKGHFYWDSV